MNGSTASLIEAYYLDNLVEEIAGPTGAGYWG